MMLTADALARTLQKLGPRAALEPDVSDARWRYRQAAAVLSYFDPHKLRPLGGAELGESAATHLLLDATPKEGDGQSGTWILRADVRRAALERLATVEALRSALEANHPRSDDVLQRTLDAAIMRRSLPEALSKDELRSALHVTDWLGGIVGGLPAKADIRRRLEWKDLLDPLQELAQLRWFCGRSREKQRLREFVERSPATSLYVRPPLFVCGPAGVGKSTLLASFLVEYLATEEGQHSFFAYLDFNRPGLVDALELMIEVARQLATQSNQASEEWSALRKRIKDQLAATQGGGSPAESDLRSLMARKEVLCDFANAFGESNRRLLLVLDNFDEARLHGDEFTIALWNLLNEIQGLCPGLRCIQAGRDLPNFLPLTPFELAGLDPASSEELLEHLGVADPEQARKVADQVDGNPQSLHLAARVLQRSRARLATFQGSKETVQASLYREYLTGIEDPELRRLAQYSFVLRHVTPVTVQQVLAEPCGLEVFDRNRAERIVADLRREMLPARISDNEAQHPAGIRRVMLRLLRQTDPERVEAIHQAAIRFYKKSPDFEARTEEMYHRLSSGELVTLGPLAQALRLALDDFPALGQRHLADALEIKLPLDVRALADLEHWERKVEQQARREINRNRAKRALTYLRERMDRSVGSKLYLLEAVVHVRLNSLETARDTIERGLLSIAQIGDCTMHVDLLAERARLEELEEAAERASVDLEDAWMMARRIDDPKRVLSLSLRRLRLHPLPASRSEVELKREVRNALLAVSDTWLKQNPSDLWDSAATVGEEYPEVISRAVRLVGSPKFSQSQLHRLFALVPTALIRVEPSAASASSMGAQVIATESSTGADVSEIANLILDLVKASPRPEVLKGIVELIEAARTNKEHSTVVVDGTRHRNDQSKEPGVTPNLPESAKSGQSSTTTLKLSDERRLVDIITKQARSSGTGALVYFINMMQKLDVPQVVRDEFVEGLDRNAELNAGRLVKWALSYGSSRDERIPLVSSIIQQLYDRAGYDDVALLTSLTAVYGLANSPRDIAELRARYLIPQPPDSVARPGEFGPPIHPIGSTDPKTLQGFLTRNPDFLDVWLLKQAIERARSVCLIEVPRIGKKGSGVLIDKDLILTNFHVISKTEDAALSSLEMNVADAFLRFGAFRSEGAAAEGQIVGLARKDPVVAFSPVNSQDFALLRVDGAIAKLSDVAPALFATRIPAVGTAIHILQHPQGGSMKLALSSNGVTGTDLANGLIQYVTHTEDGSSGSPCFDADWRLIALHHAQRAGTFGGVLREGILMNSIYKQIAEKITVQPS